MKPKIRSVRARSQTSESNGESSVVRSPAAGLGRQRRRVRPRGLPPARHRHRHEPRRLDHRVELLPLDAVVVGDVRARAHAQRLARLPHQAPHALGVVQLVMEQRLWDRPLRQVVDPLPAAPLDHHHLAVHQRPLDGDLPVGPVPPLALVLRAAQLRRGLRALGPQLVDHLVVRPGRQIVVPVRAVAVRAAAEREVRPLLDRQDAGGVRPVLEGVSVGPVGVLDRLTAHGAQARVRNELVRAGQYGDRVELDLTEGAQHPADPGPAVGSAQEPLSAQRDPAGFVGGQFGGGARRSRHGTHPRARH